MNGTSPISRPNFQQVPETSDHQEKRAPQFGELFDECIRRIRQAKELARDGSLVNAASIILDLQKRYPGSEELENALTKILKKAEEQLPKKRPRDPLEIEDNSQMPEQKKPRIEDKNSPSSNPFSFPIIIPAPTSFNPPTNLLNKAPSPLPDKAPSSTRSLPPVAPGQQDNILDLLSSSEPPKEKFTKILESLRKKSNIKSDICEKIMVFLSTNPELISMTDSKGDTIVHIFFYRAGVNACRTLLRLKDCRPLVSRPNGAGEMPLHLACRGDAAEGKIKLLRSHKAKADAPDRQGHLPAWNNEKLKALIRNLWDQESEEEEKAVTAEPV